VKEDAYPRASLRPHPSERHGRRLGARAAAVVVASAAVDGLMLVTAGCGGSSGAKVAQVGTTSAAKSATPARFSACMRSHGVPSFPDPGADGTIHVPSTIDDGSPIVRAAYRACRSLAPELAYRPGPRAGALSSDRTAGLLGAHA
jgi:hypothetical protein